MTGFPLPPPDAASEAPGDLRKFCRQLASAARLAMQGKLNAIYQPAGIDLTLTANAASTAISDPRLSINSVLHFMPMTANAAGEIGAGTLYVTAANMNNGAWTITHANNAQTDRTFRVLMIG